MMMLNMKPECFSEALSYARDGGLEAEALSYARDVTMMLVTFHATNLYVQPKKYHR
jgi:hypothetical protein